MYAYDIEKILVYNKNFMGCYAWNQLPPFPNTFPRSLIINTAHSDTDGEHWVALLLQNNRCFYFDSFGLPVLNKNILYFLRKYKKVTYTDTCIQHLYSEKCGKFCIGFIKNVNSKKSYDDFISQFEFVKLYKNDEIIENIYL